MPEVSKSPQRNTFQRDAYIKRNEENGVDMTSPDVIAVIEKYDNEAIRHAEKFNEDDTRVCSLEYELLTTQWILEKARNSEVYAQNLYAAICNNEFQKIDPWVILQDKKWGASWRYAGGIIADMRQDGDYIDWYCSGIRGAAEPDNGYVSESIVTEEIEEDLKKLGWIVTDIEE